MKAITTSKRGRKPTGLNLNVEQIEEIYFQTKRDGKSPEEIGKSMGLSEGMVNVALASLKANWRGSEGVYAQAAKNIRVFFVRQAQRNKQAGVGKVIKPSTLAEAPDTVSSESTVSLEHIGGAERSIIDSVDQGTRTWAADLRKGFAKINQIRAGVGLAPLE